MNSWFWIIVMLFSTPMTPADQNKEKVVYCPQMNLNNVHAMYAFHFSLSKITCRYIVIDSPIVSALAKMTPERMNTISEALLRMVTSFLTKNCPQKPAKTETDIMYRAEKKSKEHHQNVLNL